MVWSRAEDQGIEKRNAAALECPLATQQALKPLGLEVGQQQRVIVRDDAARVVPGPSMGVPFDDARPALDFDDTLFVELAFRENLRLATFDDEIIKTVPVLALRPRALSG